MSQILYLITILSVVLFKSETSFAQELKKDLGVCGKTIVGILEMTTIGIPKIKTMDIHPEEFCDIGRYEHGANFIISLYNAKNELVYDKKIFLNPIAIAESIDPKTGKFKKTKINMISQNSRIIKFPLANTMGVFSSYKVRSLESSKESAMTPISW